MAVNQRSDSPRLVNNQKEFDLAVKDYVLKDIAKLMEYNGDTKFVRKTRMGGHMSNTLRKAGLNNVGIMEETFAVEQDPIFINQDSRHFELAPQS